MCDTMVYGLPDYLCFLVYRDKPVVWRSEVSAVARAAEDFKVHVTLVQLKCSDLNILIRHVKLREREGP